MAATRHDRRLRFRPPLWATLLAATGMVLTLAAGNWQLNRASQKESLQADLDRRAAEPVVSLPAAPVDAQALLHRRVTVTGKFAPEHTIYLDNRVHGGRAGYHVLTPLRIGGAQRHVLVNRGWVAGSGRREELPMVPTPAGEVTVEGVVADASQRVVELSASTVQGRVWQNLHFDRYQADAPFPLQPMVLLQTSDTGDGLVREWPRPDARVHVHRSYAGQWFLFSALIVVLYVVLNLRRQRA
ncbi:MAG: SURF1 family protein [Pseudomonadota bacterium]